MAEAGFGGVLRRKIEATKAALADGVPGADRGWRLGLARAARDRLELPLDVLSLVLHKRSLAEVLELPPQHGLLAILQGPADSMGLAVLSPPVLAGLIEAQTLGKVGTAALATRKPTRTDAAMVAEYLDQALTELEQSLVQEADLVWAGGYRYASFLDDPRPLGLLLEDFDYRVLTAVVSLGAERQGTVLLILPAEGKGLQPAPRLMAVAPDPFAGPAFSTALAAQVEGAHCLLDAVISRVTLPLGRVMGFAVGDVIALPRAGVDSVQIETSDGRRLAEGQLGQNRGMRAVRLTLDAGFAAQPVQASVERPDPVPEQFRHSA